MPTSNLGLVGAFGAGAASDSVQKILERKFIEAFQRQQLELQQQREAENRRQFDVETGQRGRGLDLEQARLDASMRPKPVDPVLVRGIKGKNGPESQFVVPTPGQSFEDYEKPTPEKSEPAGSDYNQALIREAARRQKPIDQWTSAEELAFRKQYQQADDQPKTPFSFVVQGANGPMMVQGGNPNSAAPIKSGGQPVAPPLTSGQRNDIVKSETNINELQNITNMFKPEYVGPAVGRYYSAAQLMPGDALPQPPEGFADFASAVAHNRSQIINLITGAAVGKDEQKRIEAEIPLVSDRPEVFQAKIRQSEKNKQRLIDIINRTKGGTQSSATSKSLSESDIQAAMTANKWTREKAVSEAQARGYVVR